MSLGVCFDGRENEVFVCKLLFMCCLVRLVQVFVGLKVIGCRFCGEGRESVLCVKVILHGKREGI